MFHRAMTKGTLGSTARVLTVGLCLAALTTAGVGSGARADDPKPAGQDDEKLRTLLRTRLEVAQKVYDLRMEEYKAGKIACDALVQAGKRLFASQLDLAEKKEDRVAACQKHLERLTATKRIADAQFNAGALSPAEHEQMEYERIEAEIILEREKAK